MQKSHAVTCHTFSVVVQFPIKISVTYINIVCAIFILVITYKYASFTSDPCQQHEEKVKIGDC